MEDALEEKGFEALRDRILHTITEFCLQENGHISVCVIPSTYIYIKVKIWLPDGRSISTARLDSLYRLTCHIKGTLHVYAYTEDIGHEVYDIIDCVKEYPHISPATLAHDILKPLKKDYENNSKVFIDLT